MSGEVKMIRKIILSICIIFIVSGCATSQKALRKISLNMSKDKVIAKIGEPKVVRGSIKNKFNQVIEIWEYELSTRKAGEFFGDSLLTVCTFGILGPRLYIESQSQVKNYWLYFCGNKLTQWGQAGDWKREADRIYDINFSTGEKLTR